MANRPVVRSSRDRHATAKSFPRTARVNESLREVIAEELELIDDDRLPMVTVTGIASEPDLRHATVFFSALLGQEHVAEALAEHRTRLQGAVARQLRLKRTPQLTFEPDAGVLAGQRIESILRTMPRPADGGDDVVQEHDDSDASGLG